MGMMLMLIRIVTTCADSILQVKEKEELPRAEQCAGGITCITWHSYSSHFVTYSKGCNSDLPLVGKIIINIYI